MGTKGPHGYKLSLMNTDGSIWVQMGQYGYRWVIMGTDGSLWVQIGHFGYRWVLMVLMPFFYFIKYNLGCHPALMGPFEKLIHHCVQFSPGYQCVLMGSYGPVLLQTDYLYGQSNVLLVQSINKEIPYIFE